MCCSQLESTNSTAVCTSKALQMIESWKIVAYDRKHINWLDGILVTAGQTWAKKDSSQKERVTVHHLLLPMSSVTEG